MLLDLEVNKPPRSPAVVACMKSICFAFFWKQVQIYLTAREWGLESTSKLEDSINKVWQIHLRLFHTLHTYTTQLTLHPEFSTKELAKVPHHGFLAQKGSNGWVWAPNPGGRSPHHKACNRSSYVDKDGTKKKPWWLNSLELVSN